ncbi:hypothetical protein MANES_01G230800v8 [Manihot esculenta]|uniref:Uncharacterized protein n=1 Tax=Manihot esculenta TaxID=3983 RepID=A0ACB7IH74_MANES|nr:hypothetical protein MANES_01G230800v8 [Manihot esculenta]
MMGLDSDSQPQNPHNNVQSSFTVIKGQEVEVRSDEDGFGDAWYVATVLESPPKSASKKRKKVMVEYKTLVVEDGSTPLTEFVDPRYIRPLPPVDSDSGPLVFQENDVVDARYRDGWWTGIVRKVLEPSRYRVCFDNPPDVIDFDGKDLRAHWKWVDGNWVPAEKQDVMIASDSTELLGNAETCVDSPDMSIERKNEEKAPCSASIGSMEHTVHCNEKSPSHVLPPSKKVKLAAPNGTGVHSCPSKKSTIDVDVPLSVTTLPLMKMPIEISTGETLRGLVTPRTRSKITRYKKTMIGDQAVAKTDSPVTGKTAVDPKANGVLIRIKELPKKSKRQKVAEVDCQKVNIVTRKGRHTKSPFGSPQVSAAVDTATRNINESEYKLKEVGIPVVIALEARERSSSRLNYPSKLSGEETLKHMRDQKKNLNDSVGGKVMVLEQLLYGGSSQRRKRGRPRKLVVVSPKASEAGKEEHGVQDISNEVVVKDHTTNDFEMPMQTGMESTVSRAAFREKTAEVSETGCTAKEVQMAIATVSNNAIDDDQPLSTWIGGVHSSATAEELRSSSGRPSNGWNETRGRHVDLAIDAQDDSTPDGNQCLPFVKRSLVWKTIESMEVFQIMPQKPHFQPLADCKEEYREGSAIGIMVTFASLFEKITSLQFDDSRSILESTLESLCDLEKHGFDVTVPQNRVNELLSVKNGKEELLHELRDVGRQIREHTDEKRKLDAKISDVEKKILELQEELVACKSKMETEDLELSGLQSHMNSVSELITDARYSFQRIASAPWKLT